MARRGAFIVLQVVVGLLNAPNSHAQSPAARPAFEVASVKLDTGCGNGRAGTLQPPGKLNLECITLLNLIRTTFAYAKGSGMNYTRIQILGGPDWIDSDQYDIVAKADSKVRFEQMAGPMLQGLLEERFKLKIHLETRELPVYTLTVAKSGLKLQALKEGSCTSIDLNSPLPAAPDQQPTDFCGRMTMKRNGPILTIGAHGITIAGFSSGLLASRLDRPVIDKTGIMDQFDFHLEFSPANTTSGVLSQDGIDGASVAPSPEGPSIFTAVQEQLGLKLAPGKGPVEVLVIDHVEKPSEN